MNTECELNMTLSTVQQVVAARNRLGDDVAVTGVSIDTRTIQPGDLFIAIQGECFDGHEFIADAVKKQAAAIVTTEALSIKIPWVLVDDTRRALGAIAAYHRDNYTLPVVALTGSCGKTTVKEMTSAILGQVGNVLKPPGSYNNNIGVPLTLLRLTAQHDYAVLELGANHPGEIAELVQWVQPQVAMITNIAPAHLEGFHSIKGVARAKGEILQHLADIGYAILPEGSDYLPQWRASLKQQTVITFGMQQTADISATIRSSDDHGCVSFNLITPIGTCDVRLPVPGKHNVTNALAAAAAAYALGISLEHIRLGLMAMHAVPGRLNVRRGKNATIIVDDTYNANPRSVQAALDYVNDLSATKKMMILGDLGELGEQTQHYHHSVGAYAKDKVDALLTYGLLSQSSSAAFGKQAKHFSSQDELIAYAMMHLEPNTVVLVKGSRSMKMEHVVAAMVETP